MSKDSIDNDAQHETLNQDYILDEHEKRESRRTQNDEGSAGLLRGTKESKERM